MVEFISQILVKKDQNRKKNLKPQLRRDGCGDVVGWSLSVEGSYNESFHLREKLFHCKRKKTMFESRIVSILIIFSKIMKFRGGGALALYFNLNH
jgi:hypothetical protein